MTGSLPPVAPGYVPDRPVAGLKFKGVIKYEVQKCSASIDRGDSCRPVIGPGNSGGNRGRDFGRPRGLSRPVPPPLLSPMLCFCFREARETVVALSDGNQGNGFFVEDLEPGVTRDKILPRSVNSESILSLNPDVVVLKNYLEGRMGKPLEQVGVETLYLDLESPEAWLEDLDKIGRLFGNTERAAELKSMVTERMAEVEEPLTGLDPSERPDTLFLYWSVRDGVSAVNVPPDGWIQTRLVEMAGGQPVWTGGENSDGWMRVNPEQVCGLESRAYCGCGLSHTGFGCCRSDTERSTLVGTGCGPQRKPLRLSRGLSQLGSAGYQVVAGSAMAGFLSAARLFSGDGQEFRCPSVLQ